MFLKMCCFGYQAFSPSKLPTHPSSIPGLPDKGRSGARHTLLEKEKTAAKVLLDTWEGMFGDLFE